jgi:hypothetical protein
MKNYKDDNLIRSHIANTVTLIASAELNKI